MNKLYKLMSGPCEGNHDMEVLFFFTFIFNSIIINSESV